MVIRPMLKMHLQFYNSVFTIVHIVLTGNFRNRFLFLNSGRKNVNCDSPVMVFKPIVNHSYVAVRRTYNFICKLSKTWIVWSLSIYN